MSYVTTRDIIIPAGTKVDAAPRRTDYISRHVEATVELTKDFTGSYRMDLGEALACGLITSSQPDQLPAPESS